MSGRSRRSFLKGGLALGAASLCATRGLAAQTPSSTSRPHYVVVVFIRGGYDSILTFDPKDPAEVSAHIDCGYRAQDRLRGEARLYGPLFSPLMRHERELCLVHGVRTDTVAHPTGVSQFMRGRIDYSPSTPLIGDLLGRALPGDAPLDHLLLGMRVTPLEPAGYVSRNPSLIPVEAGGFDYGRPSFAAQLDAAHEREARRLFGRDELEVADYLEGRRQQRVLRSLLARRSKPVAYKSSLGSSLALAFDAIDTNSAKCTSIVSSDSVDTHGDDVHQQELLLSPMLVDLATFIDQLKHARNEHGSLFAQTTILIGTELGRYPKFNSVAGKDHWPENTFVLTGGRLRVGKGGVTVGRTTERYQGVPIDYRTGASSLDHGQPIFLDSVFATLLKLAGGDPVAHGYRSDATISYLIG